MNRVRCSTSMLAEQTDTMAEGRAGRVHRRSAMVVAPVTSASEGRLSRTESSSVAEAEVSQARVPGVMAVTAAAGPVALTTAVVKGVMGIQAVFPTAATQAGAAHRVRMAVLAAAADLPQVGAVPMRPATVEPRRVRVRSALVALEQVRGGGGVAGGCCGGGGAGGGSSYTGDLADPSFTAGINSGNGYVVISW